MSEGVVDKDLDKMVRKCYYYMVNSDINNTFIIYENIDEVIEIHYDIDMRLKAVDKVIKYFEDIEEYELCHELVLLKQKAL